MYFGFASLLSHKITYTKQKKFKGNENFEDRIEKTQSGPDIKKKKTFVQN
jgi:hypothetical protein